MAEICSWLAALFFDEMLRRTESVAGKIWAAGFSSNKGPLSCAKLKFLRAVYRLSLAGCGGEGGWGDAVVQRVAAWRRRGTSTASESLYALIYGVLQQRTEAGGYLRPASAYYGRKATILDLTSMVNLPPGFKPLRRISSSCCCALLSGAGPSGASPVPVFLVWRRSSAHGGGEGTRGPDYFLFFCPEGLVIIRGVFYVVPTLFVDSPVTCSSTAYK
jgi:hypothetical protein